jgi:hypothetical protein
MQLAGTLGHLTYCTNIHAGESWPDVFASVQRHLPEIKAEVSPEAPFGVGLRLSAAAATALRDPAVFDELQDFLTAGDYYIFTLNGFPYGTFHGQPVKEGAYRPDWTDPLRLAYTNTLADHLANWLPSGMEGSISTVPGTFKPWATGPGADRVVASVVHNIVRHVAHLVGIHETTGRSINLCLEPEPCCLIETIGETVRLFEDQLFADAAVSHLARLTGLSKLASAEALRRHLGVCYDVCHAAVEFEDAHTSLAALDGAGIRISKLQLSSALRIPVVGADTQAQLHAMDEPIYMHQVVENRSGRLTRYLDIPEALAAIDAAYGAEWRVHFHVPVFLDNMQTMATTQQFLKDILAIHAKKPVSAHLEVETYTWDILPQSQRAAGASAAIARELAWVKDQLTP